MAAQTLRLAEIKAERDAQHAELLAARAGLIEQRFEIEKLKARLARALRVAFGRSSEKLRNRLEQLELTLADIDELLGETEPASDPETAATSEPPDKPSKPARRPARDAAARRHRARRAVRLPRLWRSAAAARRRYNGDPGLRAGFVSRRPACASQAVLPGLRDDRSGAGAKPAGSAWTRRPRSARPCVGRKVLRPPSAAPSIGDLRPRGRRSQPLHAGRHGGPDGPPVRPLVDAVSHYATAAERVHADDTVVPVLEPGLGRTRTARRWMYVRDDRPFAGLAPPAVLYRYSPDRKGEHPRAHLRELPRHPSGRRLCRLR